MEGKVKKYLNDRGFGFIQGDDGIDVFFHISDVLNASEDGPGVDWRVSYEVQQTEKGLRAREVKIIEGLESAS